MRRERSGTHVTHFLFDSGGLIVFDLEQQQFVLNSKPEYRKHSTITSVVAAMMLHFSGYFALNS